MFFYGIEAEQVRPLIERYGQDILIGVETRDPSFNAVMDEVVYCGGLMHAHMTQFELSKIYADSVGIDVTDKKWTKHWQDNGWRRYLLREIELYDRLGFYSFSIDLTGSFDSSLQWLFFLRDVDAMRWQRDIDIKWMLWDVNEVVMSAIVDGVRCGEMRKHMFAPFAVFGPGTGDHRKQAAYCDILNIRAITPQHDLPNLHKGVLCTELISR
jgi:hypothetical protein